MRTYWDTSAAINAAISSAVFRRLQTGEHVARLHLLVEFFATMTGRGVEITDEAGNAERMVFTQNECAAWLKNFAQRVTFEELTKEEALAALGTPGAMTAVRRRPSTATRRYAITRWRSWPRRDRSKPVRGLKTTSYWRWNAGR